MRSGEGHLWWRVVAVIFFSLVCDVWVWLERFEWWGIGGWGQWWVVGWDWFLLWCVRCAIVFSGWALEPVAWCYPYLVFLGFLVSFFMFLSFFVGALSFVLVVIG